MSKLKKSIVLLLITSFLLALLPACSFGGSDAELKIVTTVFSEYDWACVLTNGISSTTEVTNLLDSGVDLHSYQPTFQDLMKIADADLFIYVGGESDEWVEDALKTKTNDRRQVICLMDVLGEHALEEEEKEGMQSSGEEEEEEAFDEHVWLSVKNAKLFVGAIASALESLVPSDAAKINENMTSYKSSLDALDLQYQAVTSNATNKTLLFTDRFPFLYLVKDYGLDYYAAFSGCSAESSASFQTVLFLAGKVNDLDLKYVCVLEGNNGEIANAVIGATTKKNAAVLTFNSLQTATSRDRASGVSYLSVMQQNLTVLQTALS